MNAALPWLRVFAAVSIYVVVAFAFSTLARRVSGDPKSMEGRSANAVLAVGTLANLVVLAATMGFVVFVDQRPLSTLGLALGDRDVSFGSIAVALTAISAIVFLLALHRSGLTRVQIRPVRALGPRILTVTLVLFLVAVQEEVLYRGYITVNLMDAGVVVVLIVGTLLFTAVHFLTNRAGPAQAISWLLGGLLLGGVYVVSGSIWVAVALHFAIDVTNVLAFDIAGDASLVRLSPPLSTEWRTVFRAASSALVLGALFAVYGARVAPLWGR